MLCLSVLLVVVDNTIVNVARRGRGRLGDGLGLRHPRAGLDDQPGRPGHRGGRRPKVSGRRARRRRAPAPALQGSAAQAARQAFTAGLAASSLVAAAGTAAAAAAALAFLPARARQPAPSRPAALP